jgi:hypothetical protein
MSTGAGAFALILIAPWAMSQPPNGAAGASGRGGGRGAVPLDYADNTGWQPLFDGKTLNGWTGLPAWYVRDGSIYVAPNVDCQHGTGGTTYLIWQGTMPNDFELKWEWKGNMSVNGGFQYRSYMTNDLASDTGGLHYPGRAGGGGGRGGSGGGGGRGGSGGGGRANAVVCNPAPQPPSAEERARYDMSGPQFDFNASNMWPGAYYEQHGRSTVVSPGQVVLDDGKTRSLLGTIADRATLDSWFHRDDWNQFMLVAKGNVSTTYMNGHLVGVFIDANPAYFRPGGKLGLEVESTGEYWTRNIYLKPLP